MLIDKACIDQEDIERSLSFLPVFLAGCQTLLVLAGPTYTSRLWCVVECFVFLKVGGTHTRLSVIPIGADKHEIRSVYHQLSAFDLQAARCFLAEDRERLVACIAFCSYGAPVRSASRGTL